MKFDIISSLRTNRLLLESVDASVKNGFKDFLKKANPSAKDTSRIRNTLNELFLSSDALGKNTFKYGKMDSVAPWMDPGDAENGPGTDFEPGSVNFTFYIFFDNGNTITENTEELMRVMSSKYHHKFYDGPDGEYYIDFDVARVDTVSGPYISLTPNARKGYIEVFITCTVGFGEGTDVSGVTTPTGKIGAVTKRKEIQSIEEKKSKVTEDEGPACPECGSTDVNIHNDGTIFHCVACGYEWDVKDADDCGKADDEESPEEIKKHTKEKKKVKATDDKGTKKDTKTKVEEGLVAGGRYATDNLGYVQVLRVSEGKCTVLRESPKDVLCLDIDESVQNWVEVRVQDK